MPAATVVLESTAGRWQQRAVTDDEGRFAIDRVPRGTFTLAASDGTHPRAYYGQFAGASLGTELTLNGVGDITDVEIRLTRGGIVAGVVRLPSGDVAASAEVALLPVGMPEWVTAMTANTTSMGRYRIFGVADGTYTVAARLRPHSGGPIAGLTRATVVPTLYGDVTDFSLASLVEVTGGVMIDADITLQSRPYGSLRGRLQAQAPVAGRTHLIEVMPEISGAPWWWVDAISHVTVSTPTGTFLMDRIAQGSYTVVARRLGSTPWPDDAAAFATTTALVHEALESEVALPLTAGLTLEGEVACGADAGAMGGPTMVHVRNSHPRSPLTRSEAIRPDGRFRISGLVPGRYSISVTGGGRLDDWTVHQVSSNGQRSRSDVWVGTDPTQVHVLCSARPTTLGGRVTLPDGRSGAGALVVVEVSPTGDQGITRVVRCDSQGHYELNAIGSGEFIVRVIAAERISEVRGVSDLSSQDQVVVRLLPGEQRVLDLRTQS